MDEFSGEHEGLILAEIELKSADEPFDRPDWLGAEVTGYERYYHLQTNRNPVAIGAP